MTDGSVYRFNDYPSLAEGFNGMDPVENAKYVMLHCEKVKG